MAEIAVPAGSAAPAAAALLRLVGFEHDKYRDAYAERRQQNIKYYHSTSPRTVYHSPAPKGIKNPPPEGGGKTFSLFVVDL